MRQVISEQLWLGNAMDARDTGRLHDVGVATVVDLAMEESPAQLSREAVYCRFPLVDGAGNATSLLCTAIETTAALIRRQAPTLVACSAGMSRSPAIAAAALALANSADADECLHQLTAGAACDVSPALWTDVRAAWRQLARG